MSHGVKATFNEVSAVKMELLERAAAQDGGPGIEKISATQVVVHCTSEDEAEVRAFMAAPDNVTEGSTSVVK